MPPWGKLLFPQPVGSVDDPPPWQDFEARLLVGTPHDLEDKVAVARSVHEAGRVIGAISEEMLEPWPALADDCDDDLSTGAIGDVCSGEIET
jgi:hypothetical protein